MQFLDFFGAFASFVSTIGFIFAAVWAWPCSLTAIVLNLVLYLQHGIYGDCALECCFLFSTGYGWYQWVRGGERQQGVQISYLGKRNFSALLLLTLISVVFLAHILRYSGSTVSYLDAFTTAMSLLGVALTCHKYMESWTVWLVVDVAYTRLFYLKHLPFHTVIYALYCLLAITGWWVWRQQYCQISRNMLMMAEKSCSAAPPSTNC